MRNPRVLLVSAVTLCLVLTLLVRADDAAKDTSKGDQAAIQGAWKVVSVEGEGRTETVTETVLIRFDGDQVYHDKDGQKVNPATFKLDEEKKPKQIDLSYTEGENKGKMVRGIYELTDDSLRVCMPVPNGPAAAGDKPPAEFKSGNGNIVATFARQKDEAKAKN